MKIAKLLLIVFLLPFIQVSASDFSMQKILDRELDDILVRALHIDENKRIYVGSDSGLYRYSNQGLEKLSAGYEISAQAINGPISNISALNERYLIISIFMSYDMFFDKKLDGFVEPPYKFLDKKMRIKSVAIGQGRWLWFTDNKLYMHSSANNTTQTIFTSELSHKIYDVNYNLSQKIYVSTSAGLYTILLDGTIQEIYANNEQQIYRWFVTQNAVHAVSLEQQLTFKSDNLVAVEDIVHCSSPQNERLSSSKIEYNFNHPRFLQLQSGNLLVMSECGVYEYNLDAYSLIPRLTPPLTESKVWLIGQSTQAGLPVILETRTGQYFVNKKGDINKVRDFSTASMGGSTFAIAKIADNQYAVGDGTPSLNVASTFTSKFDSLSSADIQRLTNGVALRQSIKVDSETIWLASQTNGLFEVKKKNHKWLNSRRFFAGAHVRSLYLDKNELWVATEGVGLHAIDIVSGNSKQVYSPPAVRGLLKIFPLSNGELLVGTTSGLLLYNKKNQRLLREIDVVKGAIWGIAQDSKNNLWVGSHSHREGLYKLDSDFNVLKRYSYLEELPGAAIMDVSVTKDDQPLIATWGAGLLYRSSSASQFTQLTTEDGLPSDTVHSIIQVADKIWLSTEQGLAAIELCYEPNCNVTIKTFSEADGLPTNLFDLNGANLNQDGSLIYGGFHGVAWFDPLSDIKYNTNIPNQHYLTHITSDGKRSVEFQQTSESTYSVTQPSSVERLTLFFNSNDYVLTNKKMYRYRINSENWVIADTPIIALQSVAFGKYDIEFTSSNSEGKWSDASVHIALEVQPPFWLSKVAMLLYLLLMAFFIILLVRYRSYRLQAKNKMLTETVAQKTEKLNKALIEKEKMFETTAHELQTPLTLVLNHLELATNEMLQSKKVTHLEIAKKQTKKLITLIRSMLNNAEQTFDSERYIEQNIVRQIELQIETYQALAKSRHIQILVNAYPEQAVTLELFSGSIATIFGNLIHNAIKYSPEHALILVSFSVSDEQFKFAIKDQGPGFIEPNKIGNKFYRENNSIDGNGLGLYIVQDFVSKNGGECSFNNGVLGGANVEVLLPVQIKQHSTSKSYQPLANEITASTKYKLYLVEDDQDLVELFIQILSPYFELTVFNNGKEALTNLDDSNSSLPDLILSDVMMPIMNGYEFCKLVKSNNDIKHIPFLLLTAKSDSFSEERGLLLGADDYIFKPIDVEKLRTKLLNLLDTLTSQKEHLLKYVTEEINSVEGTVDYNNADFVETIKARIKDNVDNSKFSAKELASLMNMSVSKLNRLLSSHFSMNFTQILRKARLTKAHQLILTGHNIQVVMAKVGYTSQSYFIGHFKEVYNQTPKQLQKASKEQITS